MVPMTRRATAVTVPSMPDTVHLRADLNVAGASISGSVQSPSGEPSVFDGWLGLISIIERVQASLGRQDARGVNSPEQSPDDELGSAREPGREPS
jgi:hypothetical protein